MATPNIVPRNDSEGQLGTTSKYWAAAYIDAIYVGAGKVGRDADNLLDFSTDNQISIKIGGNNEIIVDFNQMFPATNDGMALGYPGNGWSNLFLASGAVINFDNSNVTLTHSSNRLTLADSDELAFGAGNDLRVYHNATNSYIENYTGNLYIQQTVDDGNIIFTCDDGSGGLTAYLTLDGGEGHMIASKELNFADGIPATFGNTAGGDLEIKEQSGSSYILNNTGNLQIQNHQDDGDIIFKSDDGSGGTTEYLTLDGGLGYMVASKQLRFLDSVSAYFGSDNDMSILHDGSDGFITNGEGSLTITNNTDNADIILKSDDGAGGTATYFYLDGSSATHDGSATTALYTNWLDNSRISLGTSHDLQIYHDGTRSRIENSTGDLRIIANDDQSDIVFQADNGSTGVATYFLLDGSAATHDGSATTALFTRWLDNSRISLGSGHDLQIYHNGSNDRGYIYNATGDLYIENDATDGDIKFFSDDGSGGTTEYFKLDGANTRTKFSKTLNLQDNVDLYLGTSSDLRLVHNGSDSVISNSTGDLYIVNNVDDKDIILQSDDGSGGTETYLQIDGSARTVNFSRHTFQPDGIEARFGTDNDLKIYHDGSNSFIADVGTGTLNISGSTQVNINSANGENGIQVIEDAGVKLRHNNNAKLETTSTGIDVTGEVKGGSLDINGNADIAGNLVISGTTALDVTGNVDDNWAGRFENTNSGGFGALAKIAGTSANEKVFEARVGNNTKMAVTGDGNATFAGDITVGDDLFMPSGGVINFDSGDVTITHSSNVLFIEDGHLRMADSKRFYAGSSGDLEIYHDGSNSFIANTTGVLTVSNTGGGYTVDAGGDINLDAGGNDIVLKAAGSEFARLTNSSQDFIIENTNNDKDIIFKSDDGSGSTTAYITLDGSDVATVISTVKIMMPNLPSSDPGVTGQLWNDSGTLKIS